MMTPVPLSRQATFWLAFCVLSAAAVWLLSAVLLPFVTGITVAYFFNPVCGKLERLGLSRSFSALLVLGLFVSLLVVVFITITPTIVTQTSNFALQLPGYLDRLRDTFQPRLHDVLNTLSDEDYQRLREAASSYAGQAAGTLLAVVEGVWRGGAALASALSLLFIMPVVAFYLLRDWPLLLAKVDSWLPRPHAEVIRAQVREVDRTLAGFLRGQSTVCLILGIYYALALTLVGLNFGIVIGLLTGLLSFMPFVGATFGLLAALLVALVQFDGYTEVAIVGGIFLFAQIAESNFITPKLVGESVGLHPVWIIFALMAGGSLLGFVGLLLAVPVAAVIGVLLRFVLGNYLQSRYYRSAPGPRRRIKPL